jgi:hypothetical protein
VTCRLKEVWMQAGYPNHGLYLEFREGHR